jgi:acylphosphatase
VIRRRLIVHGHVQGVGFRWAIARWAKNRADGTVEAVLEGEPEAVDSIVRLAREGPRGAQVERIDLAEEEPEALRGFATR